MIEEEIWNGDKEKNNLKTEYFGVGDLEVSNNDKYLRLFTRYKRDLNIIQYL